MEGLEADGQDDDTLRNIQKILYTTEVSDSLVSPRAFFSLRHLHYFATPFGPRRPSSGIPSPLSCAFTPVWQSVVISPDPIHPCALQVLIVSQDGFEVPEQEGDAADEETF